MPLLAHQVCTCKFVCEGSPPNITDCVVHDPNNGATTGPLYPCGYGACRCPNYRPRKPFVMTPSSWPLCVCGHVAQDH